MSLVILIVCVIGYFVAYRSPRLRRYKRVILAVGVLAFAVVLYEGRHEFAAGFIAGLKAVLS